MPFLPSATREGSESAASEASGSEGFVARLTQGLARGDEGAFREFYAAYGGRLLRYLFVVARGDEQAASDALQETFVRVARHARAFEAEEKFWSWLTVLARSAAADQARRRSSYWRMLARFAAAWRPDAALPAPAGDADEHLVALLREELARLPGEDRALVHAKYLGGASMREVAAAHGLTERAVESRLARVRRRLREQISKRLRHEETH